MRTVPKDKYDFEELANLNAADWQIAQLNRNPDYVFWGVGEDYMYNPKDEDHGWATPKTFPDWQSADTKNVNELNEIVNFYFAVERDHVDCPDCHGTGHNPETEQLENDFYDFDDTGRRWVDKITDDEVATLWESKRLHQFHTKPTAAEVNAVATRTHDAINRWILVETRAKRLGVWGKCPHCKGDGIIYIAEHARLELNLWKLYPRKSASRGIRIEVIQEHELPEVLEMLRAAAKRNAERFSKLT